MVAGLVIIILIPLMFYFVPKALYDFYIILGKPSDPRRVKLIKKMKKNRS
jgi:hypothetical protein